MGELSMKCIYKIEEQDIKKLNNVAIKTFLENTIQDIRKNAEKCPNYDISIGNTSVTLSDQDSDNEVVYILGKLKI